MNVIPAEEIKPEHYLLEQLNTNILKHDMELDNVDNELALHHKKIEQLIEIIDKYENYLQYSILIFTLFLVLITFIIISSVKYEFAPQFNFFLTVLGSITICQLFNKLFLK
jgi:uncharacterized membrane protein